MISAWDTLISVKQTLHSSFPRIIFILLHIVIETPAGLNFIFRPSYTLSSPSYDAHPVIRQYGFLLLVTNILLGLLVMDFCHDNSLVKGLENGFGMASSSEHSYVDGQTLDRICGILFLYHIGPFWRALLSLCKSQPGRRVGYGGALVVTMVHTAVGAGLLNVWLQSWS